MEVVGIKDLEAASPVFRGRMGRRFARFFLRLTALDKINNLVDRSGRFRGAEFASRLLKDLGVNYLVGNAERLHQLPEGAFITVSNHPYGGLDGVMSMDLLAYMRPDFKFMVNKILAMIQPMTGNFITVTPVGNKKTGIKAESLSGIRETLTRLRDGHPVGFFPSGAVSDFSLKTFTVRDREWQPGIINLVHAARVPILPIRFFDLNSPFFYFLGLINWRIRLLRMPHEVFNKRNRIQHIGIGELLSVEKQGEFADASELGRYLRKAVYEMALPTHFVTREELRFSLENKGE